MDIKPSRIICTCLNGTWRGGRGEAGVLWLVGVDSQAIYMNCCT